MSDGKKLIHKIAEITQEVKRIPKTGWNDFHKYAYATESDIKQVIREELAKRDLVLFSDIVSHKVDEVLTAKGKTEYRTTIEVIYTLEDAETSETRMFKGVGTGQDAGDKGVYKAQTGALKYALTNLFQVPTGADPETEGVHLQPPKKATEDQIKTLKVLIGVVAKLRGHTEEEETANILYKKGIETFVDDVTEEQYQTLLRYSNELKNHYEKVKEVEKKAQTKEAKEK
ncbi:ERF family protein [Enterococcus sp. LJL99]